MTKQRRQAMGMWVLDADADEWDPWDGSIQASGCSLIADRHGNALVTISYPHKEIHSGGTFRWTLTAADDAPVADNASGGLFFSTCNKELHMTFQVLGGGDAEMHLHEAVAPCADGTAASIYNLNRSASQVTTVIGTTCPTLDPTDKGTMLARVFIPGGTGPKSGGGGRSDLTEWILAASQTYLIMAVNRAGANKPMTITSQWYEEDPL